MTAVVESATGPIPLPVPAGRRDAGTGYDVDIVVPVFNEESDLGPSIRRLHGYLSAGFPFSWHITIADNASTDATPAVARSLTEELPGVGVVRLEEKGRGRALRHTWLHSDATVVAYMDVDLSTDLAALLPLIAPLLSGHSDIAIGSRLSRGSRVVRGAKREAISRCYNLLLRTTLRAGFSDAQCGFKAMRSDRAEVLLPVVRDTGWFWDTELLVLAERLGLRIHEVPVDWVDDPDSRVDVVATALADIHGILRLTRAFMNGSLPMAQLRASLTETTDTAEPVAEGVPPGLPRQLARFAVVGGLSTLAYMILYLLLRPVCGAQGANAASLLITAVANTAANRRFTFSTRGRDGAIRHQAEGLIVFALGLAVTSGSLAALHALPGAPSTAVELTFLVAANLLATVLRFVMLKSWVFHPGRRRAAADTRSVSKEGAR
ncbi:MAG: hypothetical protein QG622_190 [Actinomycetota bacterium]|nr:hypothetical protein [Actinomycetota bacterium]